MADSFYIKMNEYLRARPRLCAGIAWANRLITLAVFAAYPILLAVLFAGGVWDVRFIGIPAASFIGVSVVRSFLHQERPYESLPIVPLVAKETKEKSFPSRHAFSVFMIAMTYLAGAAAFAVTDFRHGVLLALTAVLFVLAVFLAAVRVLLGVHFLRDVVAGAVIAVLCGLVFFL